MHIPDGVLGPQVCAVTGALSAGAVGYSLYRLRDELADRTIPMTGMMGALIFAGQMVNFPIGVLGVPAASGHLMGGVLAAAILGPWAGCLAITLVLLVQCLLFADGGILALGANVLNMGVIGAWGGYAVMETVRRFCGKGARGTLAGVVIAAWLSVMAASAVFCLELWFSPGIAELNFANIVSMMVLLHSIIGVGEAIITGGVISFVLAHRPDLIAGTPLQPAEPAAAPAPGVFSGIGRLVTVGLVVACVVAAFLAPFASSLEDGLETVANAEFADRTQESPMVFVLGDYEIPAPVTEWNDSPLWQKVSVSLAGLLGVAAVALTAWLFDRGMRKRLKAGTA